MLDAMQGRAMAVDTARSPHVLLRPLPLDAVSLADDFWEPRRRINRRDTLPSQYRYLEETGRLDNVRRASSKIGGEYQGIYFNDSDVYKWLEESSLPHCAFSGGKAPGRRRKDRSYPILRVGKS